VEDSITAIRNRLIIISRTGKDVLLDAAAMMSGTMTRIMRIFRNIAHSPISSPNKLFFRIETKRQRSPDHDSRGFQDGSLIRLSDYRFKKTKRPTKPTMAVKPNAAITSEVDGLFNAQQYGLISFCKWFFMSAPF
jgi:hypothetical protein